MKPSVAPLSAQGRTVLTWMAGADTEVTIIPVRRGVSKREQGRDLQIAMSSELRSQLVNAGYIYPNGWGISRTYTLTDRGRAQLTS